MSGLSPDAVKYETVFDVDVEKLAEVYAQGVLGAAGDPSSQATIVDQLKAIVDEVLDAHPTLEKVFRSALVSQDEKLAIVDRVFGGRVSETMLSFLKVLTKHDRLGLLRDVARAAAKKLDERSGRVPVEVQYAIQVDPALESEVTDTLRRILSAEPVVTKIVNPNLIAGLVIRVGDRVFDASARSSFERTRKSMVSHVVDAIQSRPAQFIATNGEA